MKEKIIKMSEKGQLVVPNEIRKKYDFESSDRFIAIPIEDGVIFKKIEIDVKKEFEKLSEKVRKRFEEEGIEKEEVEEAVEWARNK